MTLELIQAVIFYLPKPDKIISGCNHSHSFIIRETWALHGTCCGQECDRNGVSCINCTDYQECSGGAPKGPILSCKNGANCGEQPFLEHCWIKLNCYALNECTEVGIFPDLIIESNYFVCLSDSGSGFLKYDFTCPEGEFFDKTARMCVSSAVTSETTLSPTADTTPSVPTVSPTPEIPNTTSTPDTTTSISSLAPTAETTTPAVTSEKTTTPENTTITSIPNTTLSIPTVAPAPETTTAGPASTPTIPPSQFSCTAPGIFPNPTNCKMYFRCSTSLKVFYYICPGTSYFNENLLKCSLIITPACREQILQNTTTTPMTTVSTTATTPVPTPPHTTITKSPVPTITTLSSTQPLTTISTQAPETTTTTQIPFSCSAAGTFENPLDCKTYYRCSSSGITFLYMCPNGSYYNEFTKRCGLAITPRCRSKLRK